MIVIGTLSGPIVITARDFCDPADVEDFLVCFLQLLEELLAPSLVGVQLHGASAVRLADLGIGCRRIQAEDRIDAVLLQFSDQVQCP